jgi:hypothetical protein
MFRFLEPSAQAFEATGSFIVACLSALEPWRTYLEVEICA